MLICINSSNRPDKQITLEQLSDIALSNTVLAIPVSQGPLYKKWDVKKLYIPNKHTDLPSQRQYVMEHTYQNRGDVNSVMFMDDDLTFLKRNKDMKLRKCSPKHVDKMLFRVMEELEQFPMVGVSTRLGNNRVKENHADINRVTRCYALDVDTFFEVGAKFNPIPKFVMEDFHLTLCWLNAGKPNRIIYDYAQNDIGSNAEGGCSLYRTAAVQRDTARWMHENHPEVKLKWKKGWKGMPERLDVVIGWKKAYKGKTKKPSGDRSWL